MATTTIGVIMNGVTGRMGTNQHLIRSICAIREQGGVRHGDDVIMPEPVLTGRNQAKLAALAQRTGIEHYTTDLDAVLGDERYQIFFDASGTPHRKGFVEQAIEAGKAIYCEKPTAISTADALDLAQKAEKAGVKNGVVQDKLWLPGLRKLRMLIDQGFFGRILDVRGDFGYWVFTGQHYDQSAQRPSWNYRAEDGGGMVIDMHCHWRYVIDNLFGNVTGVFCRAETLIPERIDEDGKPYQCTADDAAYAIFSTDTGIPLQFTSSWATRVRRDDLFTMHVNGTDGSAVVGLRKCWAQDHSATPRPVWNPDIDSPINHFDHWQEVPDATTYDNAFKIQWEYFLKHVACDAPYAWGLREGAKGVQLAELSLQSHAQQRWVAVPAL
jgi:predicted dehydrogenase